MYQMQHGSSVIGRYLEVFEVGRCCSYSLFSPYHAIYVLDVVAS